MKYRLSRNNISKKDINIKLDGSKSISNRLLVLQQISAYSFDLVNLSNSDDTVLMQQCLASFKNQDTIHVYNAGTVTRFLTAFLATQDGSWTMTCDPPMKLRPIKILVDVLLDLGADIEYLEKEGFLPIKINGKLLQSKKVSIDAGVSSQYITALMMIAPLLSNGLTIELEGVIASRPYLEITVKAMLQSGFNVSFVDNIIRIDTQQNEIKNTSIFVESDWSAAAFYYTLATAEIFHQISMESLLSHNDSTQGDSIAVEYYNQLGIDTKFEEKTAILTKGKQKNGELIFDFLDQPDMVPAFAVACGILGKSASLSGVRNLVIKESNRLVAMQNELKKLDVNFYKVTNDLWKIEGKINKDKFDSTVIDTYHDHRIAMTFGVLGFLKDGLTINNPQVVSKSYPQFWDHLKSIGLSIQELD